MPQHQPVKIVHFAQDHRAFRRPISFSTLGGSVLRPVFLLAIEPSPTLRAIIEVSLRRFPFPISWTLYDHAVEALKDIQSGALPVPDLALIEQDLPGLDGFEAVRLMRARGYATQITLLFAQNHPMGRVQARLVGANHVLVKPFKTQDLERLFSLAFSSSR